MFPGPVGGQYRTRDVIASELLEESDERVRREEREEREERPTESENVSETHVTRQSGDTTDEEPAADVDILTGPAAPE